MPAASTVMLAIQGGVRLYEAIRRADVDAKRSAGIVLPLPRAPEPTGGYADAAAWFEEIPAGMAIAAARPDILAVLNALPDPTPALKKWLVEQYRDLLPAADVDATPLPSLTSKEAIALATVRQWAAGESGAPRSPLQTVAGEVVNIAIDYFAHTPGAVSTTRPEGRALQSVLEALDDTDFATADLSDAAGQIVLSVIGAVSKNPDLGGGGEKEQLLVKGVASALAKSAGQFLSPATPTTERWAAANWLHLVGAAVLEGSIDTIAANPKAFLGRDAGPKDQVIFHVTKTVADLLIGDDHKLTFRDLLSGRGLESVVASAVLAISENPDVLGPDNRGLRTILIGVMKEVLANPNGLPKDLGPELIRVILAKTAENLDLVWPDAGGAGTGRHLLLTAAKSLLQQLATPAGGAWRPTLTKSQMVSIVETVLDEVVDNPAWVIAQAGGAGDDLAVAVAAMLKALAAIPENSRLQGAAAAAALEAGILAVAGNHDLLAKLPATATAPAQTALEAAVGAIVGTLFDPAAGAGAKWSLARASVAVAVIRTGLAALARHGVTQARIDVLRQVVANLMAGGKPFDEAVFVLALDAAMGEGASP